MRLLLLLIINKAGGLIYQYDFQDKSQEPKVLSRLSSNEYLVLAGMFHGIHAISSNLMDSHSRVKHPASGNKSSRKTGIETLVTQDFTIDCLQSATGTKFVLFTANSSTENGSFAISMLNTRQILAKIQSKYANYAMRNPFYTPEMPIRCSLFDKSIREFNN